MSGGRGVSIAPGYLISHTYIEIPLEVKLRFGNDPSLRPYIFAGIAVGLLSSERAVSFNNSDGPVYSSTTDVGLIGGAGLDYVLPSGTSLFIDGSFRVNTNGYDSPINDLRFCAGILFPI